MAMNKKKSTRYVKRYYTLLGKGSEADFNLAKLLREVFDEFPRKPNQAKEWLRENLDVQGSTLNKLEEMARGVKMFPDADSWIMVGGWSSISLISNLRKADRNKVFAAVDEKLEGRPSGASVDYGFVTRTIATNAVIDDPSEGV